MEKALLDFAPSYKILKLASREGILDLEADWSKIRGLEFREALESREILAKKLKTFMVNLEKDFVELVSPFFLFFRGSGASKGGPVRY